MEFSLINLIAPLFALIMIANGISYFRRDQRTWRELLTWTFIWGGFGFLGAWPGSVDRLSGFLGIKSGLNVLIFSAIVILFYIVFQLITAYENLEMRLTKVIREQALKDAKCLLEQTKE
ncbi:MAG: DUF2304 domain-containing protein [Candidatus Abawacabacteria bacterium]|nr:DUF2304 domain-containing protein [Candidatus Abawacabacteria bacterium]